MRTLSTGLRLLLVSLATVSLGILLASPEMVSAHERRAIAGSKAEAVVGWLGEPAWVNEPNGIDFRVTDPATKQPIEGLEKTVKVEVSHGATKRTFDLRTRFGQPGAYTADVIPTSTGDYSFRFFGEVNGVKIDEKFESGPGRFDGIRAQGSIMFPAPNPTIIEVQNEARTAADSARMLGIGGIITGLLGLIAGGGAFAMRGRGNAAAVRRDS